MAQLAARGELAVGEAFVHGSLSAPVSPGALVEQVDSRSVLSRRWSRRRGRAWLTAMGTYLLDPDDPFPAGFLIGERS